MTEQELIAAFWDHYEKSGSGSRTVRLESEHLFWAWERVSEMAQNPPAEVVEVFVELADSAPDDRARCYLGAGPLEDLILHHGAALLESLDGAARRHEHFRVALGCVHFGGVVDQNVSQRLGRFGSAL